MAGTDSCATNAVVARSPSAKGSGGNELNVAYFNY
jgi:hypothetical protein